MAWVLGIIGAVFGAGFGAASGATPQPGGRGQAPPSYPEGFTLAPAPYGVSFTGTACSEPRLIELAYAFEQATKRRVPPQSAP